MRPSAGSSKHDLVKVYNDRGAVICAALPTQRLPRGVCHGYEFLGVVRPDGRAGQIGRPRRLPQPADARAHADQVDAFARRRQLAGADRGVGPAGVEHMSATFAAMEKDAEIKRTLKEAQLVPAK